MKKKEIVWGLFIALAVALLLSPFASSWPDGLEWVAEGLGFLEKGEGTPVFSSPMPDYVFPGVAHGGLATALAGGIGTLVMFGVGFGVAWLLKKRQT